MKKVLSHARGNTTRDIFEKRKRECSNSCEDDTILETESSDSYGGITFFEEHRTFF